MTLSATNRVLVNTIAQYFKTIINIVLSFYSTRLILEILGVSDFGIYSLIAGVVTMLSFITNALIVTTQRFMSYHHGMQKKESLKKIFNDSIILHIILGFGIFIILEICSLFIFDGFLSIPIERISAAKFVYHFVALTLFFTFITAPYKALLVSNENIVYISVIDIIDSILKLLVAISLFYINFDGLILYALSLLLITIFNFFVLSIYSYKKYEECIIPSFSLFNLSNVREMFSFAIWNIYCTGCVVFRTQGIAIVLNKIFGPSINSAYGISFTISNAIQFVGTSLCNAMNPQIMKAEGSGDRKRMLRLAEIESKFGFLLIAMIAIPCIYEMEYLLALWLEEVPEYACFFSRMILLAAMFDQLTVGLGSANQAIGNIKKYSLCIFTIKLLALPASIFCVILGYKVESVMFMYVLFEFISSLVRIPFLSKTGNLDVIGFIKRVLFKVVIPVILLVAVCNVILCFCEWNYRVLLMFTIPCFIFIMACYFFALCKDEKNIIKGIINKLIYRYNDSKN